MPSTYPFPLAVNSSHHSRYHRFLLGAPEATLSPMPKPYCTGRLAPDLAVLTADLSLPKWQKLYNGSFPWVEGHGDAAYDLRNVAPHRPLPASFARPVRRFAAFDFVQLADPSVSALALVGGDHRVLRKFVALNESFCAEIERAVRGEGGEGRTRAATGRAVIGHFAEPNNRWLMPCLHVHSRFLNFTATAEASRDLATVDAASLGQSGREARSRWLSAQATLLRSLGYSVDPLLDPSIGLIVQGVDQRLLAALDSPRLAVLKVLERLLGQETWRGLSDGRAPGAQPILAAMAEHLESLAQISVAHYRPEKVGLPVEGPWRQSIHHHLRKLCPVELLTLRQEAKRATGQSVLEDVAQCAPMLPAPAADSCHGHLARIEAFDAAEQLGLDPDLGTRFQDADTLARPQVWLCEAVLAAQNEVVGEMISRRRPWIDAPRQKILRQWEQLNEPVSLETLRRELRGIDSALERNSRHLAEEAAVLERRARPAPKRILGELLAMEVPREHTPILEARSRGRSL